jgi:hypothetical protein
MHTLCKLLNLLFEMLFRGQWLTHLSVDVDNRIDLGRGSSSLPHHVMSQASIARDDGFLPRSLVQQDADDELASSLNPGGLELHPTVREPLASRGFQSPRRPRPPSGSADTVPGTFSEGSRDDAVLRMV